jgi:hypothetical protein
VKGSSEQLDELANSVSKWINVWNETTEIPSYLQGGCF